MLTQLDRDNNWTKLLAVAMKQLSWHPEKDQYHLLAKEAWDLLAPGPRDLLNRLVTVAPIFAAGQDVLQEKHNRNDMGTLSILAFNTKTVQRNAEGEYLFVYAVSEAGYYVWKQGQDS